MSHAIPRYCVLLVAGLLLTPRPLGADEGSDPYRTVVINNSTGYGVGYVENPYAGILRGAAALVRANADAQVTHQKALLEHEKVLQKKLETRRKVLEQWTWERDYFAEETVRERQREQQTNAGKAATDPPRTEVLSSKSLNDLLKHLRTLPAASGGDSVPVEPDWLVRVHTTCVSGGNVGLLKEGRLPWPMYLRRPDFDADREQIDRLLYDLHKNLVEGQLMSLPFEQLKGAVGRLDQKLTDVVRGGRDVETPSTMIGATRFVRQVRGVVLMLEEQTEKAAFYLKPLQGTTVGEVVQYMDKHGLEFAPATNGCEREYVALHRAFSRQWQRLSPTLRTDPPANKP